MKTKTRDGIDMIHDDRLHINISHTKFQIQAFCRSREIACGKNHFSNQSHSQTPSQLVHLVRRSGASAVLGI